MSMKKSVVAIAISTVAVSGVSIGMAHASNSAKITKADTFNCDWHSSYPNQSMAGGMMQGRAEADLATVLADLVAKKTITAEQSKAITDALTAARTAAQAAGKAAGDAARNAHDTVIANAIGIDVATLQARLAKGESLATIAGAKKDALIAALVAEENKEIDAAVTAGKLTAAQATTLKANVNAHVTAMVNATPGAGPMGRMGGMGGRGHGHGPRGDMDMDHGMMPGGNTGTPVAPSSLQGA
jgi:polyhydroxyalkanoate synthesis regulator phasin